MTTTTTYLVRNPADEHETSAWICQAVSEADAAHQYLAQFWSAYQDDETGRWRSPTYTGDIHGGDLEITQADSPSSRRPAQWIEQAAASGKTLWLGARALQVTYDEQVALCTACGGDHYTLRSAEFRGTTADGRKWEVRIDAQRFGHVNPATGLVTY